MKSALIGVALIAASLAGPAAAQAVVEEPGYCAQFYPNANCQNYGPGNPIRSDYRNGGWSGSHAWMARSHPTRHHRRHAQRRMH